MDTVVVRYSELGTKTGKVKSDMKMVLRQRIQDRLEYEEIDFGKVSKSTGRIICRGLEDAEETAEILSHIPGVASTSPAETVEPEMEDIIENGSALEVGDTFGIDANTAGKHSFNSQDIERKLGAEIEEVQETSVDLDNPETLLEVDLRPGEAFIFTERFEGPNGFPVGTGDSVATLISGGIDSPVAAYRTMCRGSKITPIYFYNKPVAAEDHLLRFNSVVKTLKKYNPSKDWKVYIVDMEEVNRKLMDEIDRGRMLIHRRIMFKVAQHIKEQENLSGIVTGESIAQKSSQTVSNLETTSKAVDSNIFRPLLTEDKHDITSEARKIGTFQDSSIKSACTSLSPENPATRIEEKQLEDLEQKINVEKLVEKAREKIRVEKIE